MSLLFTIAMYSLLVAGILCCCSTFEWWFHRYIMHRKIRYLEVAYNSHALKHHRTYRADGSYVSREPKPEGISMHWWAGPLLVSITSLPGIAVSLLTGIWGVAITNTLVCAAYFTTYETLHYVMHAPRGRAVERLALFMALNRHHHRHHMQQNGANFNVVLPFADWVFGTLVRTRRGDIGVAA